jgi:hypothetical protein
MSNQKLTDWVKSKSAEGYSSDQIKEALEKEGYTSQEISEAMNPETKTNLSTNPTANPKKSKLWLFIIIGIVVIGIICVALYFFVINNNGSDNNNTSEIVNYVSDKNVDLIDENGNNLGQMHIDVNVDMEVVTEEGYEDFKQKFASCQSASVESKLFETITYYYEIIGPKEGLCEVKSKFTANPNPEWVNKEMICLYDNSLDFETAVQDMSRCSGELYDLMTNPGSYQ